MNRSQALQNIAKKGKTEVPLLEKELAEIIETIPQSDDRERLALNELNRRHSGPPDKTSKFDVCIIGAYKLGDFSAPTFKTSLEAYKKNPEDALERKLVKIIDEEPVVLDIQKTIDYGKGPQDNPNHGKPLNHQYTRDILALVKEEESGDTDWVISKITLRDDISNSSFLKMFKSLNVNLLGKIANDLKSAKSTKFTENEQAIDFNSVITNLQKDKIFMLGDCFEEAKKHSLEKDGKQAFYDRYIITSGECKFMNDPKKPGGNYNGTFDDFTTEEMISAFVDPVCGKPTVGEEYTLIAQTGIKKGWDAKENKNTDEDVIVMNVLGFY